MTREPNCKLDCTRFKDCSILGTHLIGMQMSNFLAQLTGESYMDSLEGMRRAIIELVSTDPETHCPVERNICLTNHLENIIDRSIEVNGRPYAKSLASQLLV